MIQDVVGQDMLDFWNIPKNPKTKKIVPKYLKFAI